MSFKSQGDLLRENAQLRRQLELQKGAIDWLELNTKSLTKELEALEERWDQAVAYVKDAYGVNLEEVI